MRLHRIVLPLLAGALAAPAAVAAQDDCPCRPPGVLGVLLLPEEGRARVMEVRPGFPAEVAGLREGDVVIGVDGAPFPERPGRLQPGDTVRYRVTREGVERDVVMVAVASPGGQMFAVPPMAGERRTIVLHADSLERPLRELTFRIDSLQTRLLGMDSAGFRVRIDSLVRVLGDSAGVRVERLPRVRVEGLEAEALRRERALQAAERPFFLELGRRAAAGAELAPMNEGLARYFDGQRTGALVIDVAAGTPAERAGLQPGDVIVRAAGEPVAGPDDVRRHLTARGGSIPVQVVRQGRRRDLTLAWEPAPREERIIQRRPN